jgi:hypothetical protein
MKNKQIIIALLAISLIAITFVSTAAAYDYFPFMVTMKKGKTFTFTINTLSDTTNGPFDGTSVDPHSIVMTFYDAKGNTITVNVDPSSVVLTTTLITINLTNKDLPPHATSSHATGSIPSLSKTFYASGPGWGWGGVR